MPLKRVGRFRLRTLLFAILLIAIACAWYGHQLRMVHNEQRLLHGAWQALNPQGIPLTYRGKPIVVEFVPGNFVVDPLHAPGWLDFVTPRGTSLAIYRWEGKRLRVMQRSAGTNRPSSFENAGPSGKAGVSSATTYLLERLPN
jgi:hypothetical protein